MMQVKIAEIFQSFQGEGIYRGMNQVFVRFFGCNLNCSFCDTKLTFYKEMSVEETLKKVTSYERCHSVSLTGGEPLMQIKGLISLARCLKREGKSIYLETNGTLYENLAEIIEYVDIIAMDFKLPSSTLMRPLWEAHREFLKIALQRNVFVKAVITEATHRADILTAITLMKRLGAAVPFVLQPQHPFEEKVQSKVEYFYKICQDQNRDVRIIEQMHKRVGIP